MTPKDLTPAQTRAVATLPDAQKQIFEKMLATKENLIHFSGGFWSFQSVATNPVWSHKVPQYYARTHTMRRLEEAGLIERTHEHPEAWLDSRRVKIG